MKNVPSMIATYRPKKQDVWRRPGRDKCDRSNVGARSGLLRQIERRVLGEEVVGAQLELMPDRWHDRKVLRVGHMMKSHGVPQDNVGIFDRAICAGPGRQPIASFALHRIIARRIALIFAEGCNPELIVGEAGTALWVIF